MSIYQGYPDFQFLQIVNRLQLVATYNQPSVFYLYPNQKVKIKDAPSLAFQLDVIRSNSEQKIYGKLNFTTEFCYADQQELSGFYNSHNGASVTPIPVRPYKLSFYAPAQFPTNLADKQYESSWFSTMNATFVIMLSTDATELIEKTLTNNIVGFMARLDAFIEGVSPRFNTQIQLDPKIIIERISDGLGVSDGIYDYDDIQNYLYHHLDELPLVFDPDKPDDKQLLCQAILDRLFNNYGSLYVGPANSNRSFIKLTPPAGNGRLILNMDDLVLTQRPLTYLLDPFAAAQQIAQTDPDKIIYKYTAPQVPIGKVGIDVYYSLPAGLSKNVKLDMTIKMTGGYYGSSSQTIQLLPDKTNIHFELINSSLSQELNYEYQLRVNYLMNGSFKAIVGEKIHGSETAFGINRQSFPCPFFTLMGTSDLLAIAKLTGVYKTGEGEVEIELNQTDTAFSYPVLSDGSYATLHATSLDGKQQLQVPGQIIESTTLGVTCFPSFGQQKAEITVLFYGENEIVKIWFQPEGSTQLSEHTFIKQQNTYTYLWNSTSIFQDRFRYKPEGGEWSEYVKGKQTITIKQLIS